MSHERRVPPRWR